MPVRIFVSGKSITVNPSSRFTTIDLGLEKAVITVDPNYYVAALNMTGK